MYIHDTGNLIWRIYIDSYNGLLCYQRKIYNLYLFIHTFIWLRDIEYFFYLFVLRHIRHFFLIHIDFINCKTKVVGRTFWHMATYGAYTAVRDSGGSFPSIRF